ncbi:hypothetical protein [Paenibacillus sp. AR247]|uniref:hypothetical protein n=1 Tax=Paenibacillus sp. AR247 TaxID=1631599 RepID=UPI00215877C2|nr:hypothetical protein [Paenibacillus sp. AR247]
MGQAMALKFDQKPVQTFEYTIEQQTKLHLWSRSGPNPSPDQAKQLQREVSSLLW